MTIEYLNFSFQFIIHTNNNIIHTNNNIILESAAKIVLDIIMNAEEKVGVIMIGNEFKGVRLEFDKKSYSIVISTGRSFVVYDYEKNKEEMKRYVEKLVRLCL